MLNYQNIQRTTKNNTCISGNRYKAFKKNVWESIENKSYFIDGIFLEENKKEILNEKIKRNEKKYIVDTPNGIVEVTNLDRFAREHNLTSGTLHSTFQKNNYTKGYKVIKRI